MASVEDLSRAAKACHRADRELGCGSEHTALPDRLRLPAAERMEASDAVKLHELRTNISGLDCSAVPGSEILYVALNCHGALKESAFPHLTLVQSWPALHRRSNCHLPCGWKLGKLYKWSILLHFLCIPAYLLSVDH